MTEPKWWVRDLFEETAKIAYALCRGNNLTAAYADQPEPLQTCADLLNDYQQRISDLEARAALADEAIALMQWDYALVATKPTAVPDDVMHYVERLSARYDALALPSTTKETQ